MFFEGWCRNKGELFPPKHREILVAKKKTLERQTESFSSPRGEWTFKKQYRNVCHRQKFKKPSESAPQEKFFGKDDRKERLREWSESTRDGGVYFSNIENLFLPSLYGGFGVKIFSDPLFFGHFYSHLNFWCPRFRRLRRWNFLLPAHLNTPPPHSLRRNFEIFLGSRYQHLHFMCSKHVKIDIFVVFLDDSLFGLE